VFRDAADEDLPGLLDLERAANLAALAHVFPPELHPYPRAEIRARWTALLGEGEHRVLVAEQDGAAVGVVAVRTGWLDGLYVVPEAWGSGVAVDLHDAGLDGLRAAGETACRLWVLEANARARRFYERRGWELDGTTRVVPYPPNPLDVGYTIRL
jgi:GNAT superfamily N-acetyltransferase